MATKPTKQQVAQAKARAGGNNPIKVTNSGLKKLGSAALLAASFTPAGRVVKSVATVAKAAKAEGIMAKAGWNAAAKTNYRAQVKREAAAKTSQIAKNSVKVKPAAKQKPNQPSAAKLMMKEMRSESGQSRKASIQTKNLPKNSNAATQPSNWGSGAKTVKINSAPKSTADSARAASSNAAKKPAPANIPSRTPANPARGTVKINSAKTVRVVKVAPKKK